MSVGQIGLIVGVSCFLCSSAMARRLELSPCNTLSQQDVLAPQFSCSCPLLALLLVPCDKSGALPGLLYVPLCNPQKTPLPTSATPKDTLHHCTTNSGTIQALHPCHVITGTEKWGDVLSHSSAKHPLAAHSCHTSQLVQMTQS